MNCILRGEHMDGRIIEVENETKCVFFLNLSLYYRRTDSIDPESGHVVFQFDALEAAEMDRRSDELDARQSIGFLVGSWITFAVYASTDDLREDRPASCHKRLGAAKAAAGLTADGQPYRWVEEQPGIYRSLPAGFWISTRHWIS